MIAEVEKGRDTLVCIQSASPDQGVAHDAHRR